MARKIPALGMLCSKNNLQKKKKILRKNETNSDLIKTKLHKQL